MTEPRERTIPSILTLGTLGALRGQEPLAQDLTARRKPFCLLIYLALGKGQDGWHERSSLCAMFWPESTERRARASLRQAVRIIERSLGPVVERSGSDQLRVAPGAVRLDADEFEHAAERGDWTGAARCYRGPFLDAVHLRGAPAFGGWADLLQLRMAERYRTVLEGLSREMGTAANDPIWLELVRRAPHDGAAAYALAESLPTSLLESLPEGPPADPSPRLSTTTSDGDSTSHPIPDAPDRLRHSPGRLARTFSVGFVGFCAFTILFAARRSSDANTGPLQIAVPSFESSNDVNRALGEAVALIVATELGRLDSVVVIPFHMLPPSLTEEPVMGAGPIDLVDIDIDVVARGTLLTELGGEPGLVLDLIDVRERRGLGTSLAIRGPPQDFAALATDLGQRAATRIVDTYRRPAALRGDHALQGRPPVLSAYLAFADALAAFAANDVAAAGRHAALALARDPDFVGAKIELAVQWLNQRKVEDAQRLVDEIVAADPSMSSWDRNRLDWLDAVLRGDREARIHIATERRPLMTRHQRAYELADVGRLSESLTVLDEPASGLPEFRAHERWLRIVNLHRLGRHAEELSVTRRYTDESPELDQPYRLQARALAALGDREGVERLADEVKTVPIAHLPALVAHEAGIAFMAHGDEPEGRRWIARALATFPEVASPGTRFDDLRAGGLTALGRWQEAEAVLRGLLDRRPDDLELTTQLAVVHARTGRSASALATVSALDGAPPAIAGARAVMQARIFAGLGDGRAVEERLETALRLGAARPAWTHNLIEWRFLSDRSVLARWLAVE